MKRSKKEFLETSQELNGWLITTTTSTVTTFTNKDFQQRHFYKDRISHNYYHTGNKQYAQPNQHHHHVIHGITTIPSIVLPPQNHQPPSKNYQKYDLQLPQPPSTTSTISTTDTTTPITITTTPTMAQPLPK